MHPTKKSRRKTAAAPKQKEASGQSGTEAGSSTASATANGAVHVKGAGLAVETLHLPHPQIRAQDWRSPLVRRLSDSDAYTNGSAVVADSFRPEAGAASNSSLEFTWGKDLRQDFVQCVRTYQAHTITEYATLGVACAVVHHRASLEITEVTRRGEKADYWLGDKALMLEVSGQQDGNLDVLCHEKSTQLLSNPFGKSGFVCVANFAARVVRLWFVSKQEDGT